MKAPRPIHREPKPKEPTAACPLCGAQVKQSDIIGEPPMCYLCRSILDKGGKDVGEFMYRVATDTSDGARHAFYRPRGFWSETIDVRETKRWWSGSSEWEISVSWGCGGRDGSRDDIETTANFIAALRHANFMAVTWRTERTEQKAVDGGTR